MRIQIKRNAGQYDRIQIVSTTGIAQSVEGLYLRLENLNEPVTLRADNVVEITSDNNEVGLSELFENASIEAGGPNHPATKNISVESQDSSGSVYLEREGGTVDKTEF